jgi:predicted nucleic acid-binding protein
LFEITPLLSSRAMSLATKHALRGYDAVQLAAALEANDERIADESCPTYCAGLKPDQIIMLTSA